MSYRKHTPWLLYTQGNRCHYCERDMGGEPNSPTYATVDHVIPQSEGGSDDLPNLVAACRSCNSSKGAKMHFAAGTGDRPLKHRKALDRTEYIGATASQMTREEALNPPLPPRFGERPYPAAPLSLPGPFPLALLAGTLVLALVVSLWMFWPDGGGAVEARSPRAAPTPTSTPPPTTTARPTPTRPLATVAPTPTPTVRERLAAVNARIQVLEELDREGRVTVDIRINPTPTPEPTPVPVKEYTTTERGGQKWCFEQEQGQAEVQVPCEGR